MSGWAERDPAAPHRDGCPLAGWDPLGSECLCIELAYEDEPDPDREHDAGR